jgi:hypothetical protein
MTPEEAQKEAAENYHRAMSYLRDMQRPHGLCEPRSCKACTHCNAKEKLDEMVKAYKGRPIVLA